MAMPSYDSCSCDYAFGHSLRGFLRFLAFLGMMSSICYICLGSYFIVRIVQTEKVEWYPNAYYRLSEEGDEPVASRIVLQQPQPDEFLPSIPDANRPDFIVYPYPPKEQEQQQQRPPPFLPHFPPYPDSIEGELEDNNNDNANIEEDEEKTVFYRKNFNLLLGLATSLILVSFIQFICDMFIFISTFRKKQVTALWVYFLFNVIIWKMTLICFIVIFSDGGFLFLLAFVSGTVIRLYMSYVLHELMSDMRKLGTFSESDKSETAKEIRPETFLDVEEGTNEPSAMNDTKMCAVNDEVPFTPMISDEVEEINLQQEDNDDEDNQEKTVEDEDEKIDLKTERLVMHDAPMDTEITDEEDENIEEIAVSEKSLPVDENEDDGEVANKDEEDDEESEDYDDEEEDDDEDDEEDVSFMTQLEAQMIEKESIENENDLENEGVEVDEINKESDEIQTDAEQSPNADEVDVDTEPEENDIEETSTINEANSNKEESIDNETKPEEVTVANETNQECNTNADEGELGEENLEDEDKTEKENEEKDDAFDVDIAEIEKASPAKEDVLNYTETEKEINVEAETSVNVDVKSLPLSNEDDNKVEAEEIGSGIDADNLGEPATMNIEKAEDKHDTEEIPIPMKLNMNETVTAMDETIKAAESESIDVKANNGDSTEGDREESDKDDDGDDNDSDTDEESEESDSNVENEINSGNWSEAEEKVENKSEVEEQSAEEDEKESEGLKETFQQVDDEEEEDDDVPPLDPELAKYFSNKRRTRWQQAAKKSLTEFWASQAY